MATDNQALAPALTYMNNPIENCTLNSVVVDLLAEDRNPWQYGWSQWGAVVQGYMGCSMDTDGGVAAVNLSTQFDYAPSYVPHDPLNTNPRLFTLAGFNNRAQINSSQDAMLWWSQSLLATYWTQTTIDMKRQREKDMQSSTPVSIMRKGTLVFTRNTTTDDITDLGFFDVRFQFLPEDFQNEWVWTSTSGYPSGIANLAANQSTPNIWLSVDGLAKSMYSVMMSDLGQMTISTLLSNTTALQAYTKDFASFPANWDNNTIPGPATDSFDSLKDRAGNLTVSPQTISTKYICQVPVLKPWSQLLGSLILADLVYLQAFWKLFLLLATFLVERRDSLAQHCLGTHQPLDETRGSRDEHRLLEDKTYLSVSAHSRNPSIGSNTSRYL